METSNKKENKIRKILAPDLEKQKEIRTTFRDISYFLIIGIISIIVVYLLITILMKYSINKINKQNTIETIRNENI